MESKHNSPKTRTWLNIIIALAVLVFFVYSYQSIMNTESNYLTQRKDHLVRVLKALAQPELSDSETNQYLSLKMLETIQMAFLATIFGAVPASLLAFMSARPSSSIGRGFEKILSLILAAVRSIHPLVTVIFVIILTGIRAKSGVIALTIFSMAVLTVKYSEFAQENNSISWPILFKKFFPSLTLKHFPSNLLISSILGFMGGGGIGFFLQQHINLMDYRRASPGILLCIIVIGGFDLLGRANWRATIRQQLPQVEEKA